MATNAANQPFQMPAAPVAGFTGDQNQAFGQVRGLQGMAQPYINQGQNYLQQSAAPVTAADVNQYYNPMADSVTRQMQNIYGQQNQQNTANLTQAAGGVGADRIAIGQGNMANQQDLAAGQTYAGLYQQALQSAQQNKQMQAGAGYGISQLGPAAQNAQLQGTSALGAAGSQQQQLNQAQLNSPYQQQLAQIAFPYQQAQYLAGITSGLAPALGGTTNGQSTQPAPSALSQILGIGTAGAGIAGSLGAFSGSGKGSGTTPTGYTGNTTTPFPGYDGATTSYMGGISYPQFRASGGAIKMDTGGGLEPIPDIPFTPNDGGQSHTAMNMQQPQQGGGGGGSGGGMGDAVKLATTILPFLLARGGSVSPYDFAQGFDVGGSPVDDDHSNDESYGMNLADRLPPQPSWGEMARRAGNYWAPSQDTTQLPPQMQAARNNPFGINTALDYVRQNWNATGGPDGGSASASPAPQAGASGVDESGMAFPQPTASGVPLPPPRPTNLGIPVAQPGGGTGATGNGGNGGGSGHGLGIQVLNPDMNTDDYMMPKDKRPYPGASEDNWGTRAARSPWLALVKAGAAMASTTGPIGTVIGKGMGAGADELEAQRKSLQSEEGINQRAQQLYQNAKEHLDKYQRKTPHEVALEAHQAQTLALGKYQPVNYQDAAGNWQSGVFDARRGAVLDQAHNPITGAANVTPARSGSNIPSLTMNQALNAAVKLTSDPTKPQYYGKDPQAIATVLMAGAGRQPVVNPTQGLPPMPSNKAELKAGTTYQTPRGPAQWDGEKFIQP